MKNIRPIYIIILACFITLIFVMPKDKVYSDNTHQVICVINPVGFVLGCMDKKGNQVSNSHINHK